MPDRAFDDFDFSDDSPGGPKHADAAALRILAEWVARHAGEDPHTHATIDREFVVGEVPRSR